MTNPYIGVQIKTQHTATLTAQSNRTQGQANRHSTLSATMKERLERHIKGMPHAQVTKEIDHSNGFIKLNVTFSSHATARLFERIDTIIDTIHGNGWYIQHEDV